MKDSRRYRRKRSLNESSSGYSRGTRSKDGKERTRRIANKLQILALRRPHALVIVETVIDGMLHGQRSDDRANDRE